MNNDLDISKFFNDKKIELDCFINFTNTFNLLFKNKYYLLENTVLSLPAQQPLKSDTYNKYVAANMNSVNVGYEIYKQQSIFSGINGVVSSVLSGVIGSSLTGNPIGAITGSIGGINSVTNSIMSVRNYEKQIKAKYADVNNQLGNKLLFSSTKDMLFSNYLSEIHDQYETIIIKELTDDSIIQLNNTLILNGVYNPKYFKLNDLPKTTKHLGFYYAKLNTTNFNQVFSKHINETREIKDIILANFAEFRV